MAINIKAKETLQNIGPFKDTYRYVMGTELYSKLDEQKVMREAAMRSGIPQGTITAAWAAIGEVVKAWATEGHSVAIPGVGTMRFSVRATSVPTVGEVSTSLITSRRVVFTPSVDIKNELKKTAINITCYDRNGNIVKQVNSDDATDVEDPDDGTDDNGGGSGSDGGGGVTEDPLG